MQTSRALVLGATGFLGGAAVHALLDRGIKVSALVRGRPQECEFVRTRLYDKVTIAGGIIEDTSRLRQIIALHEIDCIYQCAAAPTPSETHPLTDCVLHAAATSERKPQVIVPLETAAPFIRFRALPPARLNVAFVKLPELFGPGNWRLDRWTGNLFAQAALQRFLPLPPRDVGVLDVASAANALVETAADCEDHIAAVGHSISVPPLATSRELYAAVKAELKIASEHSESVRATLEWYRTTASRWQGRMPVLQAAA